MWENAYLSIKNPKASRALKWALDPSHKFLKWALDPSHKLLALLARLRFATLATFGLRTLAPLDQILDPHLKYNIGGSKASTKNAPSPNFLHFHSVSSKKLPNNRLAPRSCRLRNPGLATVRCVMPNQIEWKTMYFVGIFSVSASANLCPSQAYSCVFWSCFRQNNDMFALWADSN